MTGGLGRLFSRIIPLIMLICFICFGIIHIFPTENNTASLTYLETQYVDKTTGETYTNPTEEQKNNSYKMYTFDMVSYTQNIDQDILKRSISGTFNLSAYDNTINRIKNIWADGYDFGDGIQTLVNGIVLVINTILLPINIILTAIRVVAGLILTGISLLGVNINRTTPILNFLTFLLDHLSIPLLNGTYNKTDNALTGLEPNQWYKISDEPKALYWSAEFKGFDYVSGQREYNYTDFDFHIDFMTKYQYEHISQPMNPNTYYKGITTGYYYSDQKTSLNPDYTWHFTIAYIGGGHGVADWLIYDNGFVNGVTADDLCLRFNYSTDPEYPNPSYYTEESINQLLYFINQNMYIYTQP